MITKFTRDNYLAGLCTHEQYYDQFAFPEFDSWIFVIPGIHKSKDPHFKDTPLSAWDNISMFFRAELARKNEDINGSRTWSLSDGVCAAKERARQLRQKGKL